MATSDQMRVLFGFVGVVLVIGFMFSIVAMVMVKRPRSRPLYSVGGSRSRDVTRGEREKEETAITLVAVTAAWAATFHGFLARRSECCAGHHAPRQGVEKLSRVTLVPSSRSYLRVDSSSHELRHRENPPFGVGFDQVVDPLPQLLFNLESHAIVFRLHCSDYNAVT